MTATMNRPPTRRSTPRPVVTRKVPVTVRPGTDERAQLRKDRISAVVAVLILLALIGFVIWAGITGDSSSADYMWDYPYLY